jgi:hypothetical protein
MGIFVFERTEFGLQLAAFPFPSAIIRVRTFHDVVAYLCASEKKDGDQRGKIFDE